LQIQNDEYGDKYSSVIRLSGNQTIALRVEWQFSGFHYNRREEELKLVGSKGKGLASERNHDDLGKWGERTII